MPVFICFWAFSVSKSVTTELVPLWGQSMGILIKLGRKNDSKVWRQHAHKFHFGDKLLIFTISIVCPQNAIHSLHAIDTSKLLLSSTNAVGVESSGCRHKIWTCVPETEQCSAGDDPIKKQEEWGSSLVVALQSYWVRRTKNTTPNSLPTIPNCRIGWRNAKRWRRKNYYIPLRPKI